MRLIALRIAALMLLGPPAWHLAAHASQEEHVAFSGGEESQLQRLKDLQAQLAGDELRIVEDSLKTLKEVEVSGTHYRVYYNTSRIIFFNRTCSPEEEAAPFYLRFTPLHRSDLPRAARADGFVKLGKAVTEALRVFTLEGRRLCWTQLSLPALAPYRIAGGQIASKTGGPLWHFSADFVAEDVYLSSNPEEFQPAIPPGRLFCYGETGACYRNDSPAPFVGKLKGNVPTGSNGAVLSDDYYLIDSRPLDAVILSASHQRFERVDPPRSQIAAFLRRYQDFTIVVTVKGGGFAKWDKRHLEALRAMGLDLARIPAGGSYAAIMARGRVVAEKISGTGPVEMSGGVYGLPEKMTITSAGGMFGNASRILFEGRNLSLDREGVNVSVFDKGHLVKRAAFDAGRRDLFTYVYHVRPRDMTRFWTMTEIPAQEAYAFFVAGHTYGTPRTSLRVDGLYPPFWRILPDVKEQKNLSFGVLLGDVVNHATLAEWQKVRAQLKSLAMPVYIAPGNHDLGIEKDSPRRRLFEGLFGPTFYAFMYSGDLFIFLDGSLDGWNITGEQLSFVREVLKQHAPDADKIYVFSHQVLWWKAKSKDKRWGHHIIPNSWAGWKGPTNFWDDVFPLFSALPKDVFFFAGDVGAFDNGSEIFFQRYKNASFIMTGMGGGKRDNFVIVRKHDGQVSFELIALNGDDIGALGALQDHRIAPSIITAPSITTE